MRHFITLFYAWLMEFYRKPLLLSNATIKLLFIPGFTRWRNYNGKVRAYAEFIKAKRRVPAYKAFLHERGFDRPSFNGMVPMIEEIPFTDKANYVKIYPMEARCVHGKLPDKEVIIDESSGSSGTATNWVRGKKERQKNARIIKFGVQHLLGKEPLFVINAFALGPWATGVNVTMSCVKFSKLKSIGPDRIKIVNTMKDFGTKHHYVIMGYPPFLKLLVDNSDIPWNEYHVTLVFGGESMTEGMRDYLVSKGISKVYSSLGASDLELNLAAENNFTVSLRKLIRDNEQLQDRILKHTGALPMIFQYSPTDFMFESTENGELIVTVCRTDYLSPKIRYNIHDRGHVVSLKNVLSVIKELNIDETKLLKPTTDLPLLFHYGRADMTVSFFGSNISPSDVQEVIFNWPLLLNTINSFCLNTVEDRDGNKQFIVSMEMQQDKSQTEIDIDQTQIDFFERLSRTNQDFREARKMLTSSTQAIIRLYDFAEGPFENADIRIKARYIN